ncbi:MAG: hypothetical protein ACSHX6_06725 [Akkermansiaceae bacterium]
MRIRKLLLLVLCQSFLMLVIAGDASSAPEELRTWSIKGVGEVKASFVRMTGEIVYLVNEQGKEGKVQLSRFSVADTKYLEDHYKPKNKAEYKTWKNREMVGEGFKYFVDVPSSYKASTGSTILLDLRGKSYTYMHAEKRASVAMGAVFAKVPFAVELETGKLRLEYVEKCLEHVCEEFSIQRNSVILIADGVMAETAFEIAARHEIFGLLVYNGFIPRDMETKNKVFCAVCEPRDPYRYIATYLATKYKKNGNIFFTKERSIDELAMLWIYSRYHKLSKVSELEKKEFAKRVVDKAGSISLEARFCYYNYLKTEIDFDVRFSEILAKINSRNKELNPRSKDHELSEIRYIYDGEVEIQDFAKRYFAPFGAEHSSPMFSYKDEVAAEAIAEIFKNKKKDIDNAFIRNYHNHIYNGFRSSTLPDTRPIDKKGSFKIQ